MGPDPNSTEANLLRSAQAGDTEAFGVLCKLHARRTYAAALALTGRHDAALDICQEAFAKAFAALQRIDPERPLFPWLYRTVRHLGLNHLRARSRSTATPEMDGFVAKHADDPAEELAKAELRDRCRAAISELPPLEREVLVLRQYQSLRYREIADLLRIPIGTVMSRLYSARRRLASDLKELS